MSTTSTIHTSNPKAEQPLGATATMWHIDRGQSVARFAASTLWGWIPATGHLGEVSGSLAWDGSTGRGQMVIATAALATGIALRDHHLRSRAFFHVANHPAVIFEAREVVADDGDLWLRGELFVRGRRHAFECKAGVRPIDENRIALESEAAFDLDQLGMSRGLLRMIRPGVRATVRVELKRVAA